MWGDSSGTPVLQRLQPAAEPRRTLDIMAPTAITGNQRLTELAPLQGSRDPVIRRSRWHGTGEREEEEGQATCHRRHCGDSGDTGLWDSSTMRWFTKRILFTV